MSLPEKVGQLFVSAVPGLTAGQGGADLVRRYHLGGVIYFGPNLHDAAQVARLSNGLQQAAMAAAPAVPLTVGTDQEGGIVSRLDGVSASFPSQMAAGATRDPVLVEAAERATGRQLRALGINLDYAPVADVNADPANPVIGTRSFGSDPALVSEMTQAAIAGFHAAGVAAVAKHFPGHGDTDVDSHTGLPVIHHTLRQWQQIDAPPFEAAIRSGADMIMSAHIVVPALSPSGDPATLSSEVITGVLRVKLGYHGVVVTDSLQMAGVRLRYDDAQIAVRAIQAGCDELLMPQNLPAAYNAVLAAVRDGTLSVARLDQSVRRILTVKADRGLFASPLVNAGAAAAQMNSAADTALARSICDRAVTLVKNEGRVLPLRRGARVYVAGTDAAPLAAGLARSGAVSVTSASSADAIVVTTTDATGDPVQQAAVSRLLAARAPVIVVATGNPYDLGLFPRAAAAAATYSDSAASIAAAAGVLTGAIKPSGRLPVMIPAASGRAAYPFGAGLSY
ncbi:MAG TPA: glycoside hydrolase family 3 N-terminal domain-containing protein [Streptosporangiaceae bacterium]|nr:glycoside hydrolase family 3 N-terminal domain-containing protein [Streptosporangiaceae bacterium]